MRYLVTATVKPGRTAALARAIEDGTLGEGSVCLLYTSDAADE